MILFTVDKGTSYSVIKKEILLVEDDKLQEKIYREIISEIADDFNCSTVSVHNGIQAIDYIEKNLTSIKAVVLDLILPDMLGVEVLKKIRILNNELSVIILSASEDKDLIVETMRLGIKDYIIKGKSKEELAKFYKLIIEVLE